MTGKHKLRDKKVRGVNMRRCKRCGLICRPDNEAAVLATKCPGRAS